MIRPFAIRAAVFTFLDGAAAAAMSLLCACSQVTLPAVGTPDSRSTTNVVKAYKVPTVPIYALANRLGKGPEIVIYGAGASGPETIALDGLYEPFPIATDAHQVVYVADYGQGGSHRDSSVTEWSARHHGPIRTITDGIAYPISIDVTAGGRLYVANDFGGKAGTVTVYIRKTVKPSRTITKGVKAPSAVAVDNAGYAYVADPGNRSPGGKVNEYSPQSNVPSVVVTQGLNLPFALAVDSSEDLYVGNFDNVTEYAPHTATLIRTLNVGTYTGWVVRALTLDAIGDVYAAATKIIGSVWFGEVVEYGPSGNKLKRRITFSAGVVPTSIVTDRYGNLYAIVGRGFGGAGFGSIECNEGCSLLEFPNGSKGHFTIARSNKKSVLSGPIAVAP